MNIKQYLRSIGMTMGELADRLGVQRTYLSARISKNRPSRRIMRAWAANPPEQGVTLVYNAIEGFVVVGALAERVVAGVTEKDWQCDQCGQSHMVTVRPGDYQCANCQ